MNINRKIEKMFITEQQNFDNEVENIFYQKDTNTFEFYDLDEHLQVIEAIITNVYACEFYLEHSYKYLREYLKINNSLSILGAVVDEPQLIICIEMLKSLLLKIKDLKFYSVSYHIMLNGTIKYQPSHSLNETMNITLNYNNKFKKPKTSEIMFEYVIKSLFKSELCFESIDFLSDYYFVNFEEKLKHQFDDYEIINAIKNICNNLLDEFLEFKINYVLSLKI